MQAAVPVAAATAKVVARAATNAKTNGLHRQRMKPVFLHDLFKHEVCVIKVVYLCILITKKRNYVSSRDENI